MTVRGAERLDTEWLLTMRNVADRLNVSYRTVERMIAAGELPHVRVRHLVRVHPTALREYIARQEAAPTHLPGREPAHLPRTRLRSARRSFLDDLRAVGQ